MDREDIVRMAWEAFHPYQILNTDLIFFERFAALVAEKEREECAKVCLEEAPSIDGELCAAAIRARGK